MLELYITLLVSAGVAATGLIIILVWEFYIDHPKGR